MNLDLDDTFFDFGTNYEINASARSQKEQKKFLEGLLEEKRISFSNLKSSKFSRTTRVYCS